MFLELTKEKAIALRSLLVGLTDRDPDKPISGFIPDYDRLKEIESDLASMGVGYIPGTPCEEAQT